MGDDSTKRPHRRANKAAEQVARIDLAFECLKLKETGATYEEIARQIPAVKNKGRAWVLVQEAIEEHATKLAEPAEAVRAMELRRLDAMLAGLYPAATTGDTAAVHAVLKIQERRSKYQGLDAALKTADAPPATPARVEFVFVQDHDAEPIVAGDPEPTPE